MRVLTKRARTGLELGLALSLTLCAIGAGYVAGKASPHRFLDRSSAMLVSEGNPAPTPAAEARMEGVLLLLLGRGGAL